VHTTRSERVCVGVRQVRRRSSRFWKTKTTPILRLSSASFRHSAGVASYLALKRRKLLVINGSEKPGLLIYFEERTSGEESSCSTSSSGMTCCNSLRRRRLARHVLTTLLMAMLAHLVNRRSCREYPGSLLPDPTSCTCSLSFNISLEPDNESFRRSRLPLVVSDDGVSEEPGIAITGVASSRLTSESAAVSTISTQRPDYLLFCCN